MKEIGLKSVLVGIMVFAVAFSGCDDIFTKQRKSQIDDNLIRQDRERAELDDFRKNIGTFLDGKLLLVQDKLKPIESEILPLKDEIARYLSLESKYMSGKSASGEELSREVRVLHLIRDPEVNALAVKYLSEDFSRTAAAFMDDVRNARQAECRYYDALNKSEKSFEQSSEQFGKWAKATAEQRDAEVVRIQKEIVALEAERKELLKEYAKTSRSNLQGGAHRERERKEHVIATNYKVKDLESELKKKRAQIDYLRNPSANTSIERRAMSQLQDAQYVANINRERELASIEKQLKPKKLLTEIIADYETRTVVALSKAMRGRLADMEKKSADMKAQVMALKEAKLTVPILERAELQKLRKKFQ